MRGLTTVVIPARNAAHVLPAQLDALAAQEHDEPWEVVVADHRSSDGTADAARRFDGRVPGLRVVRVDRRGGANVARNDGARRARGDLLVFCDADDVAAPGWLTAMVTAARRGDVVAGRLDTERLNDGRTLSWRLGPAGTIDTVADLRLGFLPYAPAGNVALRAEVLWELGGFPEEYRHGCDEVALVWRAQRAGFQLVLADDATMHYRFRDRLLPMAWQHFGYGAMEPRLFREFGAHGMPPSDTGAAVREWRELLGSAGDLFGSTDRRGAWVRTAALHAGRAWGSLRNGVVYL